MDTVTLVYGPDAGVAVLVPAVLPAGQSFLVRSESGKGGGAPVPNLSRYERVAPDRAEYRQSYRVRVAPTDLLICEPAG